MVPKVGNYCAIYFGNNGEEPFVKIIRRYKGRQSLCSLEDEKPEDQRPELREPSEILLDQHLERVFGAFSSYPFRMSRSFYGTGETFLYTFSPEFKMFSWTGENSYFVKGFRDSLQLGGGGGAFGLWLDDDLNRGSSFSCSTFNNQPLSGHHDFAVQELEVWTFE